MRLPNFDGVRVGLIGVLAETRNFLHEEKKSLGRSSSSGSQTAKPPLEPTTSSPSTGDCLDRAILEWRSSSTGQVFRFGQVVDSPSIDVIEISKQDSFQTYFSC